MTINKLKEFHRGRLVVLANAGADILALETIPCKLEAQVSDPCRFLQLRRPKAIRINVHTQGGCRCHLQADKRCKIKDRSLSFQIEVGNFSLESIIRNKSWLYVLRTLNIVLTIPHLCTGSG